MTIKEIKEKLQKPEYDFLRADAHLGKNIAILTLGGSHAYGTNVKGSDIDIRGMAVPTKKEILLGQHYDQIEERKTDTVIYELDKLIKLLCGCNPNTIEILGNRPEAYLYVSKYGQMILDNKRLFLSKRAIRTFAGYADQQLHRLKNKAALELNQAEKEKHIFESIENARYSFNTRYPTDLLELYLGPSDRPEMDTEIFFDFKGEHLSLRDFTSMMSELNNIVTSYNKVGARNEKAIVHEKIQKHMMHLIRLYIMGIELISEGTITTYREKEHDLLMDIRNKKYLDERELPSKEFYELLDDYVKQFEYAKKHTVLPDAPDMEAIEELEYTICEDIVRTGD